MHAWLFLQSHSETRFAGGGTDANVYINLHGENGSSGAKQLDLPGHDPFERGQVVLPSRS